MGNTYLPYEADLSLFHQTTQIPLCVFDNTPESLLRYPLIETLSCSSVTLTQCYNVLKNADVFFPHLFVSDTVFFALLKLDANTNIMLGPISSLPLTYKEFYESSPQKCDTNDLTHLYRIIQQSPCKTLTQFAGCVCLFIKLISQKNFTLQEILAMQITLPTHHDKLPASEFFEPSYTSINEAMSFEKMVLHHIRNGNVSEIQKMFCEPNFFSNIEQASSVDNYYKIFFVYATLCCIAAIEEGLNTQTSFPIFDTYISKIPTISSPSELSELCKNISLEYCQQIIHLHKYQSDSAVITQCLQYIHENLHAKITLDDLATHCNLSKRSITRHFTTHYHTSVADYILSQKLKEAAFLLTHSAFSITEISHQLAFSSQSHLSVAFKKKYFYTPQQYRDKYQQRG